MSFSQQTTQAIVNSHKRAVLDNKISIRTLPNWENNYTAIHLITVAEQLEQDLDTPLELIQPDLDVFKQRIVSLTDAVCAELLAGQK